MGLKIENMRQHLYDGKAERVYLEKYKLFYIFFKIIILYLL